MLAHHAKAKRCCLNHRKLQARIGRSLSVETLEQRHLLATLMEPWVTAPMMVDGQEIRACRPEFEILAAAPDENNPIEHVVHVSFDGVYATSLLERMFSFPESHSNWLRLVNEGASTFNGRTDFTHTNTLPNHVTYFTARPVLQPEGLPDTVHHGWTLNRDPFEGDNLHNAANPNLSYIPSIFDVIHDNGLSTSVFAGKSKFSLFDNSFGPELGAPDVTGEDNGKDKIDHYRYDGNPSVLHSEFLTHLVDVKPNYAFILYRNSDSEGHLHGWGSNEYYESLIELDQYIGELLTTIETDPQLQGKTAIIFTSDHGGGEPLVNHSVPDAKENYTIPVFAWGPGIAAGTDLYALNADRQDPGTGRPDYVAPLQPIRNGETGILALDLFGLEPLDDMLLNDPLDLNFTSDELVPTAELATPLDNGALDQDAEIDKAKVEIIQHPTFEVRLRDFGSGILDESVTNNTVTFFKDGQLLTENEDYTFSYNKISDTISLTSVDPSFNGVYEITLNAGERKIEDLSTNDMPEITFNIDIQAPTTQSKIVTFQQNRNNYVGAVDTYLEQANPDADHADQPTNIVSKPRDETSFQGLLRFDNLFGTAADQIPEGAVLQSATLELEVTNRGKPFQLHRMLTAWDGQANWNSLVDGIQADDIEAKTAADAVTGEIVFAGPLELDVTTAVNAWLQNPELNFGWAILSQDENPVHYDSAEGLHPPKLLVHFAPASVDNHPEANPDEYTLDEDKSLSVVAPGVLANDQDHEGKDLVAVLDLIAPQFAESFELKSDGSFFYTPLPDFNGVDHFTYRANNGTLNSTPTTASVTVQPENDAPIAFNDGFSLFRRQSLDIPAPGVFENDQDVDGDALVAMLVSEPAHAVSFTFRTDGSFQYTPESAFSGSDSFTYQVDDGSELSNVVTVSLIVINQLPVANDDQFTTTRNATLQVEPPGLLANDADPDNDSLEALLIDPPTSADSFAFNSDGTFEYTPAIGFSGSDKFTYRISDGIDVSNVATVTIDVQNQTPVAQNDQFEVDRDSLLSVPTSGVLANDLDADGDDLTASVVTAPANSSTFQLNADGSFEYLPNPGFVGDDSFMYTVSDGIDESELATVRIAVLPVNQRPMAENDQFQLNQEMTLVVLAPGVLSNDTDSDGDELAASIVDGPANATAFQLKPDGSFDYEPNPGFFGTDFFTYLINDGSVDSEVATVELVVTKNNSAPLALDDEYSVDQDQKLTVPASGVLDNDSDVDGDDLTASIVEAPANAASFQLNSDGSFEYTPNQAFVGLDSFTYQASDGKDVSAAATVRIHVQNVSRPIQLTTGTVMAVTDNWTKIDLPFSYQSMVVVASAVYTNVFVPQQPRIRNASGNSFELKMERADGSDEKLFGVTVNYVVVEEGVYTKENDGIDLEAVKYNSSVTDFKGSWQGEQRSYQNNYVNPVVFGQVMTANDDLSVFWSRGTSRFRPASAASLHVGKHVGEDPRTERADETIGYLVVESGFGIVDGIGFNAQLGADSIRGIDNAAPYEYALTSFETTDLAIVSQAGMDSNDGSWAMLYGSEPLSETSLKLAMDEDRFSDTERWHPTEQVGYLVFGTVKTPIPPPVVARAIDVIWSADDERIQKLVSPRVNEKTVTSLADFRTDQRFLI